MATQAKFSNSGSTVDWYKIDGVCGTTKYQFRNDWEYALTYDDIVLRRTRGLIMAPSCEEKLAVKLALQ